MRGCPPSHGREIFYIYASHHAISCILLGDFYDFITLYNSGNIVNLQQNYKENSAKELEKVVV